MLGVQFKKDIVPLAFPMFLSMLVFQIQTIINRAFLGQLDPLWLSVVSNVVFPIWTTFAMLNSLATGATIVMSHRLGAGDSKGAKAIAAAALAGNTLLSLGLFAFWAAGSGLVFSAMGVKDKVLELCVSYTSVAAFSFLSNGINGALTSIFQASAQTKPLMISGAVRSVLNILLDYLLIFGNFGFPHLGLIGAALATVLSDAAGVVVLAVILFASKKLGARPDRATWKSFDIRRYGTVVRMGLPTSAEDLLWNIGNLCLIAFLNMLDPFAPAVYGIVFAIEIFPIVIFMSLGQSATVLVGRAKGAGDVVAARGTVYTVQISAWVASIGTLTAFLILAVPIVRLFTQDPDLVTRAAPILVVSCLTFFPRSVNFMAGSGIRGLGNTKWMLGTQVFGTVFLVSLGYILVVPAGLGVLGLFIAMCIDETVRAIINGTKFQKMTGAEIRQPLAATGVLEKG